VSIRAGVTQLWEVPPSTGRLFLVWGGGMAVRVTLLGASGGLLSDAEYDGTRDVEVALPDACAMVAVTGLGRMPGVAGGNGNRVSAAAPGAVSAHAAPVGATPVTGWELRQHLAQVSPTVFLGRGSVIVLSQSASATIGGQKLGVGMTSLAEALRAQTAIETRLPATARAVGVVLDIEPGSVLGPRDFVIASRGATIGASVARVEAGNRVLLLYDVTPELQTSSDQAGVFSITVALRGGGRCAGVVGFGGGATARSLGERMNGRIPERLVPDEPLTPDGEARVRFVLPSQDLTREGAAYG
jgi:hypothetical protein